MVRYGITLLHMPGSVGGVSMEHIVWDKGSRFYKLGQSMNNIGLKRYMEGMISSEALVIQAECVDLGGCSLSLDNWAKGLAIKLLEAHLSRKSKQPPRSTHSA